MMVMGGRGERKKEEKIKEKKGGSHGKNKEEDEFVIVFIVGFKNGVRVVKWGGIYRLFVRIVKERSCHIGLN